MFLTNRQVHQNRWASAANWKGGVTNNIEIDLFQENLNWELKRYERNGGNKTPTWTERSSRAAGGTAEIICNFDKAVEIKKKASSQKQKSSEKDEKIILSDLFTSISGRFYEGFTEVSSIH